MKKLEPLHLPLTGTHLIEASAGTGKTYTVSTLFLRLLLERGLSVDQILVVTYTEAATAELRERLRRRLQQAIVTFEHAPEDASQDEILRAMLAKSQERRVDQQRLLQALRDFDQAAIFTMHGFCHRMLYQHAFESGVRFDAALLADESPMREEIHLDFWTHATSHADEEFVAYLGREKVSPESLGRLVELAARYPDLEVLPTKTTIPANTAVTDLSIAFETAQNIWAAERQTIRNALLSFDGFDQRSYKRSSLAAWLDTLEGYFHASAPQLPGIDETLQKLTTPEISKKVKKGYEDRIPQHAFFDACQGLWEAYARLTDSYAARRLILEQTLVDHMRTELRRRKDAAGVWSFDDLLQQLARALQGDDGLRLAQTMRSRFKAALIDEFQDTDPLQFQIFRRIYADSPAPLFLIGDPKQSIYAFRGADICTYQSAVQDVGEQRHTLDTNWRSDAALVHAVNDLFSALEHPFLGASIHYLPVHPRQGTEAALVYAGDSEPPLQIRFVPRHDIKPNSTISKTRAERELPRLIAADICQFLRSGAKLHGRPVQPGDIAVLVRKNQQAITMQEALRELRIPSVLHTEASVFKTQEAKELHNVLRAVAEPWRRDALRLALLTTMLGVSGNELLAMDEDETRWEAWIQAFRAWHQTWSTRGFIYTFHLVLDGCQVEARLLTRPDGERRMTNLRHLAELLHKTASSEHLGPGELLQWLAQQRTEARTTADDAKLRLESDACAVQLVTIHKSKGREYPVVYCPYLWDGALLHDDEKHYVLFHDAEDGHALKLDIGSESQNAHQATAAHERLAENLRLLYVALTRAKHRCTVVWGAFFKSEQSPLGYLLHPPPASTDKPPLLKDISDTLKELMGKGDEEMQRALRQRVAPSGGSIGFSVLDPPQGQCYTPSKPAVQTLACRTLTHRVESRWRTASFSQLTSHAAGFRPDTVEGRDRDEGIVDAAAWQEQRQREKAPAPDTVLLHAFPKGAEAGNFFHALFEHLDFQSQEPHALVALIKNQLAAYGYGVAEWQDTVYEAVQAILHTPLEPGDAALTLRHVSTQHRLNELEFYFPVASVIGGNEAAATFTREALAHVFHLYPSPMVPTDYAGRAARLQFEPWRGFLKGYIDMVFVHEGRWYVLDYKTNHLGAYWQDYAKDRLAAPMAQHHYYLQYHLYTVAVHRYLERRLADYDYNRHFGGVYYLFLRGMSPDTGAETGVFRECPPRERIEALSRLLATPLATGGVA